MLHTHTLAVQIFLLIYIIKTVLLLINKHEALDKFTRVLKFPDMIISMLFLLTGIVLAINSGDIGVWFWVKIVAVIAAIVTAVLGFKNKNKLLAIVSIVLLVYSYGISETKSPVFKKQNLSEKFSGADVAQLGAEVYNGECSRCHGADGKLGKSGALDLSVTEKSADSLKSIITNGQNQMPGYSKILSAEQIDAVATYIQSLKKN